jgi:hypothetical protein
MSLAPHPARRNSNRKCGSLKVRGKGGLICDACHKHNPAAGRQQRSTDGLWVCFGCLPACDLKRRYPADRQMKAALGISLKS